MVVAIILSMQDREPCILAALRTQVDSSITSERVGLQAPVHPAPALWPLLHIQTVHSHIHIDSSVPF